MDRLPTQDDIEKLGTKNPLLHAALAYYAQFDISWEQALMLAIVQMDDALNSLLEENAKLIRDGGQTWNITVTPEEMDRIKTQAAAAREDGEGDGA